MHRRGVERLVAVADAQEARRLLEGPRPEPRHLEQLLAVAEGALVVAMRDDRLGQRRPEPGDVGEQRRRRGVEIDPDRVDASSTTASSDFDSRCWSTSCWYCPTPIAFGSILTSSASGSCSRRAIDTAPRSDTSSSGNSFAASSDAE